MRRLVVIIVGFALVRAACGACADDAPEADTIRLGTFNIRFFPEETTDVAAVAERIAEADADALAVQEIVDPDELARALTLASARTRRDYALTLGRYCSKKREWWLGVVYDRSRVRLVESRSLTDRRRCEAGHPNAHVALFERGGERVALAAVHLKAMGTAPDHARRKREWAQMLGTQRRLERELDATVVFAGDFNSTGFKDDAAGERSFIEAMTRSMGVEVLTRDLECTAYWRNRGGYQPSLLDHIIARGGGFSEARVLGYCGELRCQGVNEQPDDHARVSDHCPVVVERRIRR